MCPLDMEDLFMKKTTSMCGRQDFICYSYSRLFGRVATHFFVAVVVTAHFISP